MADAATGTRGASRSGKESTTVSKRGGEFRVVTSKSVLQIINELQRGLPYQRLSKFEKESGLSLETIGQVIRVPKRTLARRKAAGRLPPDESERVHRLSELFAKAVHLFGGDAGRARRWLQTPQRALGRATPLEMASTEVGAREVENLIGRIEHGVFS
ncbi:MAG: DUF2384 domain-containing protein [Planctomycetota bacterium]|nr:MAG: DUF2384 domain-containing protein [Planctomycetota bacterium]